MNKNIYKMLLLPILLSVLVACGDTKQQGAVQGGETTDVANMSTVEAGHKHSFGDWTVVRQSTCLEKGARERTCACGEVEWMELSVGAHIPVAMPAVPPTCTEMGHGEGLCCSVCGDILGNQSILEPTGHIMEITPAIAPTCIRDGCTAGARCSACGEVLAEAVILPASAHQPTQTPDVKATCTSDGSSGGTHCVVCQAVLEAPKTVPATGHTPIACPTVEPTCTTLGYRGGTMCAICEAPLTANTVVNMLEHSMKGHRCSACNYCDIDFTDPSLYDSYYGYDFLGTLPNGEAMQAFYRALDATALEFHTDTTIDATDWVSAQKKNARLPAVSYVELGLSYEQAMFAYTTLTRERPLYYWMTGGYTHDSEKGTWALQVSSTYAKGSDREACNRQIYAAIDRYSMLVEELDSAYEIALALHDAIVEAVDYTYEADGKTPSGELWAHRITGVFLEKGAVCESYAVTFHLLLNYCNIENIYVEGYSGGLHAWNLVRMDDGKWYWFDLTWDDLGEEDGGIRYQFFCVSDTALINWDDARSGRVDVLKGTQTFPQTHLYHELTAENPAFRQYTLPARATSTFSHNGALELAETFTVDGLTYARWDADEICLVAVDSALTGALVIPDTVSYGGRSYTVSEICAINEQGYFHSETPVISGGNLTEIILPDAVERLRYSVLRGNTALRKVTLSRNVTYLANDAFRDCTSLTEICYEGTMAEWEQIVKIRNWDRGLTAYTVRCTDGEITA